METVQQLLARAIRAGVPLYNEGKIEECFNVYFNAATHACMQEKVAESTTGEALGAATDEAVALGEAGKFGEGAWVFRRCFEEILEQTVPSGATFPRHNLKKKVSVIRKEAKSETLQQFLSSTLIRGFLLHKSGKKEACFNLYCDAANYACMQESVADSVISQILKASVEAKRLGQAGKFGDGVCILRNCFDKVLEQNPPSDRGSSVVHVSREEKKGDNDDSLVGNGLEKAVQNTPGEKRAQSLIKGASLAALAVKMEAIIKVKDRRHHLKQYPACFVGSDAVDVVARAFSASRIEAVSMLNELLMNGLVHHVTREHDFEDKKLFYRFTTPKELQQEIDSTCPVTPGPNLVRCTALTQRLKQFYRLDPDETIGMDISFGSA